MKTILLGNAGAGKTTMARRLMAARSIPLLSLDDIAWEDEAIRKPREESLWQLQQFIDQHEEWIIEGCYGELIDAALPFCTELRFLNPGVEACVANCLQRPWEPDKFETPGQQDAMLQSLVAWVKQYETRDDEFGLKAHRAIFDTFKGIKREYASMDSYDLKITT